MEHYDNVHGIHLALDRHAEEALDELSADDRTVAHSLFQTLTEIDPGNRRIRRPAHLSEISAITGASPERVLGVIHCFRSRGRNFLVLSSDEPADDPLVDISHESLIRQWETLRAWVDEEALVLSLSLSHRICSELSAPTLPHCATVASCHRAATESPLILGYP